MDSTSDFLERSRQLREALKKRANDIESGNLSSTTNDILEASINKNIQSSLNFYKTNTNSLTTSMSLERLILEKRKKESLEKKIKEKDPFRLPEIKRSVLPYLMKPPAFPLPHFKRVKRFKIDFTGVEPKLKKLNQAYSNTVGRHY